MLAGKPIKHQTFTIAMLCVKRPKVASADYSCIGFRPNTYVIIILRDAGPSFESLISETRRTIRQSTILRLAVGSELHSPVYSRNPVDS